MTTLADKNRWIDTGKEMGANHVIVVCDTFDWEDYPVYCKTNELSAKKAQYKNSSMQRIIEVIDL